MTSLTVELGLRRHRGNSPPIPEQLANRQDITLAQKQRLAMLAKMGLGPAGNGAPRRAVEAIDDAVEVRALPGAAASTVKTPLDRRKALLEQERKARELEEMAHEEEEKKEKERKQKQARSHGLAKLGPVEARTEDIPHFLPAPAALPPPSEAKLQVNISKATLERVKASVVEPAAEEDLPEPASIEEKPEEPQDQDDDQPSEAQAQAQEHQLELQVLQQLQQRKRAAAASQDEQQQLWQKHKKKKAKKQGRDEDDRDDRRRQDEEAKREEVVREPESEKKPQLVSSKPRMVVESVKGKVSNANRNLTDADLERRFPNERDREGGGSLMTEEEALRMIRREKNEKGAAVSAARRIQRDLAEWAAAKELQRQRVKSPHRFERMVVSRK